MVEPTQVEQAVRRWLEEVVVGLNLCPFAGHPLAGNRVRFKVSEAADEEALLADLALELEHLHDQSPQTLETTLVIVPHCLDRFDDYNQFLGMVDEFLQVDDWEGLYQVASFHPDYQFAGTAADDAENLTNRSPYPILHILREASVAQAIEHHPHVDGIPEANILRMNQLSEEDKRRLFSYLF